MKRLVLLLLNLLMPMILFAASNDLCFRHFSVEDGLSSNSVRALMQDKYGFLWIGTDEGLNRYDGTTVKLYRLKDRGANEAISSLYSTLNKIWIGTDEGIYIYDYETEDIMPFVLATSKNIHIETNTNHIVEDKDKNLWFTTVGQGIFKYNTITNHLEQYEFKNANGLMASVLVDSENQIWAITNWGNSGLFKLNKAENKFETFPLSYESGKHDSNALVMLEDSEHTLWLGTWECGLQKIDKYSGKATTYLHPTDGKGATHIHSIMEYAPHQLLIGSDDGLLLFNTITEEYQLFTEDETNPHSLSNRFVYPIIKDHEGGIWIGTYYGGVNYISPNTGQFESFVHSRFSNSVNGTVIGRFCEDSNGDVWIASDDGGLNRFSPKNRKFSHYLPLEGKNSLSYHNVHALCMDDDNLWIGTYTGGVNVLNLQTGTFKTYSAYQDNPASLDGTSSYAIFKDRKERIWITSMSGVNLYNREKDNFTRIKDLDALTIDIDQDTKGNLWFSTQGKGLFKYHPEKQIWKNYIHDHKNPNSLANNQVNCVLIDTNGEMWVGTMNGLCKYNAEEDAFETLPLEIPSHNICSIIEDQRTLWLTTTKGLVRYTPGEGCRVFTKSDGLQSEQFLPNAALKASDGKIYIGSVNGFNAFYPHQIKTNVMLPPVIITELEIDNKEIQTGNKLLPKSLNQLEELELSYKENAFSLLYTSLSYCTPNKNKYAYKLEGFDKDWNYVGSQNKATYTNLPAGTYLFKVKATNNDGIWNEKRNQSENHHPPSFLLVHRFQTALFCIGLHSFRIRHPLHHQMDREKTYG